MSNFKALLWTFAGVSVAFWIIAHAADWAHPRLPCMQSERSYWAARDGVYRFERVSSFFWSSLCRDPVRPIIISASEGTGELSFAQAARGYGHDAHEFVGAHRGLKTLAYMLASSPHPERLRNLRVLAFINPVYFSFAARTDASSVSLTSVSNLAYVARTRSFHQKWDEFLLSSLFIGAKSYLGELGLFREAVPQTIQASWPEVRPIAESAFDSGRNMTKAAAQSFKTFDSKFSARVEPARSLFESVARFSERHPEASVCYVMLPANLRNLRHFGRDAGRIAADMSGLIARIGADRSVDLTRMGDENYIFGDPMHLTPWGVKRVMEEVMSTPCAARVFGKAGG